MEDVRKFRAPSFRKEGFNNDSTLRSSGELLNGPYKTSLEIVFEQPKMTKYSSESDSY